jgi:hypothetical protein
MFGFFFHIMSSNYWDLIYYSLAVFCFVYLYLYDKN